VHFSESCPASTLETWHIQNQSQGIFSQSICFPPPYPWPIAEDMRKESISDRRRKWEWAYGRKEKNDMN
jgi:hypothetical protein